MNTGLSQNPTIHKDVFIAKGAFVMGNCFLEESSSVWYNTVLRGDNDIISIGKYSNIQDLSMLHTDPGYPVRIGDYVTVGHRAIIHGCTIEDFCLIGMGATILNGAHIKRGSVVAAGAVVLENTIVEPLNLVAGIPAKPKKELNEHQLELHRLQAMHYVENAKTHKRYKIKAF